MRRPGSWNPAVPVVAAALLFFSYPVFAAPGDPMPGSDAFCAAMMDHADQIWPLNQVQQCAPWRKRQLDALKQAALDCQKAHKNDLDHLDACDAANDAADRFAEEAEYVENNRDVPPDQANPVIHRTP